VLSAPKALAGAKAASASAAKGAAGKTATPVPTGVGMGVGGAVYQDFELLDVSRALAARMTAAKQVVPHYYLSVELNLAKLVDLRAQLNADGGETKVSVLDLLVKAVGLAVKQVPDVNASWNETFVRRYSQVDVNLVMGVGSSVITPVVRDVNGKGLRAIGKEVASFEDMAFDGQGQPVDASKVAVGTISVHDLGMYGVKSAAPIVLPPQACALALGAIVDTVVPSQASKDTDWAVAPVVVATLSCDHRVIDGAVGAQYLSALKLLVENPVALIL